YDDPAATIAARTEPGAVAPAPVPTVDEEHFLAVVGDDLDARADLDQRRRSLEVDGRRRDGDLHDLRGSEARQREDRDENRGLGESTHLCLPRSVGRSMPRADSNRAEAFDFVRHPRNTNALRSRNALPRLRAGDAPGVNRAAVLDQRRE